jgi:hypothetical protein
LDSASVAYLLYLIIALIAGLSIYWIIVGAPGRRLASDIANLGSLNGKTIKEIIRAAGPPTSSSTCADGGQLLEWRVRGYHIALLFDANRICQGESRRSPPKPDVAKTGPTPVQPKIALKGSSPATIEKPSVNFPKQSTMTAPAQSTIANALDTSPLVAIGNRPKDTAIQTAIGKAPIDYVQPIAAPMQSVPKTPIVGARTDFISLVTAPTESPPKTSLVMTPNDFKQPITSSAKSSPKEFQIILCDNCGNSLKADAKFCDSCGEAVTQQALVPSKEEQTTPPNDLQDITHVIEPVVKVTERSQSATVSCENCGRELQISDKFCDKCGALIQLNHA